MLLAIFFFGMAENKKTLLMLLFTLLVGLFIEEAYCLTVVNQAMVAIPPSYPVGAPIYRVVAIDDITGQKPDDIHFRISNSTLFSDNNKRLKGKVFESLFMVDKKIGTVLLSPHHPRSSIADFSNYTIVLRITATTVRSTTSVLFPIYILTKTQSESRDTSCEPRKALCFELYDFKYLLPETTKKDTVVGTVRPLSHRRECPGIWNKYGVSSEFWPTPLIVDESTGDVIVSTPLDFEKRQRYEMVVTCSTTYEVENSTLNAIFTKPLVLFVKDINDNIPYLQPGVSPLVELDASDIIPGRQIPASFNVFDDDAVRVNNIKIELDDPKKLFSQKSPLTFTQDNKTFLDVAIHAKRKFAFEGQSYNFSVTFRDLDYIYSDINNSVTYYVIVYNTTGVLPAEILDDFTQFVNLSQDAAQFARIACPIEVKKRDGYSFQLSAYQNTSDAHAVFGITPNTGIVYLKDSSRLSKIPGTTYHLILTWTFRKSMDYQCTIVVQMVQSDANATSNSCNTESSLHNPPPTCARYSHKGSCEGGCGMSSTDGHCQWRSAANSTNPTSKYATCSADLKTCPDGHCDELEMLDTNICPQDCTTTVIGEGFVSQNGRGIALSTQPCSCDGRQCICQDVSQKYPQSRIRRKKVTPTPTTGAKVNGINSELEPDIQLCDASCIAVIAISTIVITTLTFVSLLVLLRHLKKFQLIKHRYVANRVPLNTAISDYVDDTTPPAGTDVATDTAQDKPFLEPKWEFRRDRLIFQEILGEGEFGKVMKAQAWNIGNRPGYTTVAVKTLKDNGTSSEEQDLLSELNLLREVSHPNVVQLLGACTTKGGPLYVIVEYAQYGSLHAYLRKLRPADNLPIVDNPSYFVSPNEQTEYNIRHELLSFAWQIARGMAYLSEMKLVHRDLAARNVLLAEGKMVKISDFGLSRDVYEGDTYLKTTKGRVPIKWMAIESLEDHIYTTKSDVWSFGVVLWEIITLGSTPYPGITPERLYHLLKEGCRMPKPQGCPQKLYRIMKKCWRKLPRERPSFKELVERLDKLLQETAEYLPLGTDIGISHYEHPTTTLNHNNNNNSTDTSEPSTSGEISSTSFNMAERIPPHQTIRRADDVTYENTLLLKPSKSCEDTVNL